MGRHSTPQPEPKQTVVHRVWRRLPRDFRARVWEWRQRWRAWLDRRFMPKGEWDKELPTHPLAWVDPFTLGAFRVGGSLRKLRRERGELLPDHSKEQS